MPISSNLERYLEWLGREEIPPDKAQTITSLRDILRTQLGLEKGQHLPYNAEQLASLQRAVTWMNENSSRYGVRAFTQATSAGTGKTMTRYGVSGAPGAWGMRSAIHFILERM
jgi:hypothetical protein